MALTDQEQATLKRLRGRLDRDVRGYVDTDGNRRLGFRSLRAYKRGRQRLVQLGLAVPEDLRQFTTIVAWPGTYSDAIVSRLRPQGFLLDGQVDEEMWRRWQANNLDTDIRMALADMVDYGRGYLCTGTNADDQSTPIITVESPFQVIHEWSNRERRVTAAARFYTDDVEGKKVARATLYLPDVTVWVTRQGGKWVEDQPDPEGIGGRDEHELGKVPVEPLVNRASSDDRYGESELLPIISLTDAAARALTNAQVATEVMALPQRYAAGMSQADFQDPKTGEALTAWEAYFGAVWASANKDAKFGQFAAADLGNFKTIVGLYAQLVAGITGLPMRYLGQLSDNPPSADGIRADEARLVGTAEEKQLLADGPLENTMRTADLIATGEANAELLQLETSWRSAATPTIAQAADAAVKLFTAGLISKKQARRDMGYTPVQISQMETEDAGELVDPLVATLLKDTGDSAPAGA